jgi:RING finger protein 170
MFFVRNLRYVQLLRYAIIVIVYVLVPFDLLPESALGVIGLIDDLLMLIVMIVIIVAIIAVQYIRANQ